MSNKILKNLEFVLILGKTWRKSFNSYLPDNGIAYLASSIKKNGGKVSFFDLNLSDSENSVLKEIKKRKPKIIGFKIFYNNLSYTIRLATKIKKSLPKSVIIAGGPHVTLYGETIYEITDVFDMLVIGEGEKTIVEIGKYCLHKRRLQEITNIIYKKSGVIYKNKIDFIKNINNIPFPDWGIIKLSDYFPILLLNMARGCPYQCSFCVHNTLWGKRKGLLFNFRKREIKNIIEELHSDIKKYKVSLFGFPDSTPDPNLFNSFSNYILANKIDIKWVSFSRIGLFSNKLYKKMSKSGCICLWFGIESGCKKLLKKIGKMYGKKEIIDSINLAKSYGIQVIGGFIMGFPGENDSSIEETKKLLFLLNLDTVVMSPLEIEPGSPISISPAKYGIKLHKDWLRKTVLVPEGRESFEIYFFEIENTPNNIWWKQNEGKYNLKKLGIELDVFESEYTKLLAYKLGMDNKDFFNIVNSSIKNQDEFTLQALINKTWEASRY